jgi:hypothetical protein
MTKYINDCGYFSIIIACKEPFGAMKETVFGKKTEKQKEKNPQRMV